MSAFTTNTVAEAEPFEVPHLVRCPDCGHYRRDGVGPHAPRLDSTRTLVDCAGRPVAAEFRTHREVTP